MTVIYRENEPVITGKKKATVKTDTQPVEEAMEEIFKHRELRVPSVNGHR